MFRSSSRRWSHCSAADRLVAWRPYLAHGEGSPQAGLRNARDPCRPGAGADDRRGRGAHLPDEHLRTGSRRQRQGLRLRAHGEPDSQGARDVPRRARVRRLGPRLRLRDGRRGRDRASPEHGRPRRHGRRCLRRHLPAVQADLRAPWHRDDRRGHAPARRGEARDHEEDEAPLDRVTDEPDAQGDRHRGDGRARPPLEGPGGRRQHLREPVPPAAVAPRRGPRDALDDEVSRRSLRRRRRRHRGQLRGPARATEVHPERGGRRARAVRQLARPARREDARRPDGASFGERTRDRGVARRSPEGEERELPGPRVAPAARPRSAADAQLRRHVELRAEERRRGHRETRRRADADLRPRGIARRRRVAHRDPALDDPRLGEGHEACAPAGLIRLSVGIESVDDLIADLAHAIG